MRSTRLATVTAALLIAAVAAPLAADAPPAPTICVPVLATADSVWIAEKEIEVGELSGLINGAFYLDYDDADNGIEPGIEPSSGGPNLVIATKAGTLEVWLYGDSTQQDDGTWSRKLSATQVQGSGEFANADADLALSGLFYPEKGASYQLSGSICTPPTKPARR